MDGETGLLSLADDADVAFVHKSLDLHLGQVLGDDKELGCLEAGRDGLALVNGSFNHGAVHGRTDFRVPQIGLRLFQRSPCAFQAGSGGKDLGFPLQVFRLGDVSFFEQRLVAFKLRFQSFKFRGRAIHFGLGFLY